MEFFKVVSGLLVTHRSYLRLEVEIRCGRSTLGELIGKHSNLKQRESVKNLDNDPYASEKRFLTECRPGLKIPKTWSTSCLWSLKGALVSKEAKENSA